MNTHWSIATLLVFTAVFLAIISADEFIARKNYYRSLKAAGAAQ